MSGPLESGADQKPPDRPSPRSAHWSDAPVETSADDLLGRTPFVREVARFIEGWTATGARGASYVLALQGPWGSGKTSVLNLLTEELARRRAGGATVPNVLQFSPWQFTDADALARTFFRDVARAIGDGIDEERYRSAAERWYQYAAALGVATGTGPTIAKGLVVTAALGAALGAPGVLEAVGVPTAVPTVVGLILALGAAVVAALQEGSERVADFLSARADRADLTLDALRVRVKEGMRALDRPLLVAVDDLDRLGADELQIVLRLVRSNADVPNLVFLLLLDLDRTRRTLDDSSGGAADGLLDKVVQTSLTLPQVSQLEIDAYVQTAFDRPAVFGRPWAVLPHPRPADALAYAYESVTSRYVVDLRAAGRLLNALSFQAARFRSPEGLAVFPADLLLLETLRVFEPEVHGRLYAEGEFLTRRRSTFSSERGDLRTRADRLTEGARRPEEALAALANVFSPVAQAIKKAYHPASPLGDRYAAGRIEHPTHFDRYFTTHAPDHALAPEEETALREAARPGGALDAVIEPWRGSPKLIAAFEVLVGLAPDLEAGAVPAVLDAVVPIAEEGAASVGTGALHGFIGRFDLGQRIVRRALERLPTSADRAAAVERVLDRGVFSSVHLLTHLTSEAEQRWVRPDVAPLLSAPDLERVKEAAGRAAGRRLSAMAPLDVLDAVRPLELLTCWARWTDGAAAQKWLRDRVGEPGPEGAGSVPLAALLYLFSEPETSWVGDGPRPVRFDAAGLVAVVHRYGGYPDRDAALQALLSRVVHAEPLAPDVPDILKTTLATAKSALDPGGEQFALSTGD